MSAKHDCKPDEHPDDWQGSGWEGTGYDCPDCGQHWYIELSYEGPGYTNDVRTWERDD